jgi:acyl-coenzyme A synthetase/AMP-(fatty) acid ligase
MPENTDVIYADQPYIAFPSLNLGITTVISTNSKSSNPDEFNKIIERYKIQAFFTNPFRMNLLLNYYINQDLMFPVYLKNIYIGSAPVTRSLLKKIKPLINKETNVHDVYGMTEVLPVSTATMQEKFAFPESRGDYLGKLREELEVKIANDGELFIGGNIFKGYLGEEQCKWFATGDIVSVEKEGLFLKARKKDMIINDAYNIYPQIYEPVIEKIDQVREAAMVGVYSKAGENETIYLFIVLNKGVLPNKEVKENIFKQLREGECSIDKYAMPNEIIFLKELPVKGRSFKVDKAELRLIAKAHYLKNHEN